MHAFEPNYEGSPVVHGDFGPEANGGSAKGQHRFDAVAGHHLAPAQTSDGRNVYDHLGTGYTLLAFDAPTGAAQAFIDAARARQIPLTVYTDSAEGERARYGASLVLVRPDQFVAWAGDTVDGLQGAEALLLRACGL